jgi:hypothetical protein
MIKLSIKGVLSTAFEFYKSNLKSLLILAAIYMAALIIEQEAMSLVLLVKYDTNSISSILGYLLLLLLSPVFGFFCLYIIIKLYLALTISINARFDEEPIGVAEAFRRTKGKFWRIVGNTMLIGLIVFVPLVVLILLKLPHVTIFLAVGMFFLQALYYLITPTVALESHRGVLLERARRRIKGNYLRVLALQFVTVSALALLNAVFRSVFSGNEAALLVVKIVFHCISFFIVPFASVVCVTVYRQLQVPRSELEEQEGTANPPQSL